MEFHSRLRIILSEAHVWLSEQAKLQYLAKSIASTDNPMSRTAVLQKLAYATVRR